MDADFFVLVVSCRLLVSGYLLQLIRRLSTVYTAKASFWLFGAVFSLNSHLRPPASDFGGDADFRIMML